MLKLRLQDSRAILFPFGLMLLGFALLWLADFKASPSFSEELRMAGKLVAIAGGTGVVLKSVRILFLGFNLRISEQHTTDDLRQRRLRTQLRYLEQLVDLFVIVVAVGAALMSFEQFRRFGGSLLASAGLASVIIGFAAQRSLANLIAGFQVAFTQPIRLGDVVVAENEWGTVEEINLTYVVVRLWDLRRLILPITYFLEKPFQNWTRTSASLIGAVSLAVDFSVSVDDVRAELGRIVSSSSLWDRKTGVLQVVDANENSMTLRALVSARDSGSTWDLRCEVREKLIRFLQAKPRENFPRQRYDDPVPPPMLQKQAGGSADWHKH